LIGEGDCEEEVELMRDIAGKHSENFAFVLLTREDGKVPVKAGKLWLLERPFIFAFQSQNLSGGRWFIEGEKAHNASYVDAWLTRIADGVEPFSLISAVFKEDPPEVKLRQVNALTVKEAVLRKDAPTVLLLLSSTCGSCHEFRPYAWAAVDLLEGYPIQFYWMEGPKNDIPDAIVPETDVYPKLYVWPAGDGYLTPVLYEGSNSVEGIVQFIVGNSGLNLEQPVINGYRANELLAHYKKVFA
jgi:hypothetical protein